MHRHLRSVPGQLVQDGSGDDGAQCRPRIARLGRLVKILLADASARPDIGAARKTQRVT
ncbi:hypothetical protein [Arthrobacter flavus]|uniref:Uncharacterized protein n=1 Tax=Arthrobacter flavus TaxID=95172 RepID=A0ABW4Q9C6_9MICC